EKHRTQPAAIALAWQIARPTITAPIASATSLAQLELLGEAIRVQLDQDDIRQIDEASAT
ncbi:MAG: aldo/keto reductase, partial [Burkholderia sp.]|nr:aldo/keto reductase [Burkholderia sp.]